MLTCPSALVLLLGKICYVHPSRLLEAMGWRHAPSRILRGTAKFQLSASTIIVGRTLAYEAIGSPLRYGNFMASSSMLADCIGKLRLLTLQPSLSLNLAPFCVLMTRKVAVLEVSPTRVVLSVHFRQSGCGTPVTCSCWKIVSSISVTDDPSSRKAKVLIF